MKILKRLFVSVALLLSVTAAQAVVEELRAAGAEIGPRLEVARGDALDSGLALDALIAQNEAQRAAFWTVRETIPEANRLVGAVTSHDLSLPP